MAIDTRIKLDLANEANCNEYQQAKKDRKKKAFDMAATKLTHKSEAFQKLFGITMQRILKYGIAESWYQKEDRVYEDDGDLSCNFVAALAVNNTTQEEYKEAVRGCVPKLIDNEWSAIREEVTNNSRLSRIRCDMEWLAELDALRNEV